MLRTKISLNLLENNVIFEQNVDVKRSDFVEKKRN